VKMARQAGGREVWAGGNDVCRTAGLLSHPAPGDEGMMWLHSVDTGAFLL
jgi:hypothetical protein